MLPKGAEVEPTEEVEPADVGPCPFHKDCTVRRSSKGYRCDKDDKTRLKLPLAICQRQLSLEEVTAMIGPNRKTALLEGFVSRRNRPFSAALILDDAGKIKWDFPPRDNKAGGGAPAKEFPVNPEPLGACPKHPEAKIVETATAFVCNDDGCRISIPREICKREVTRDEAAKLFADGETAVLENFTSKAGKPFSASLYIKRTGRHGFRFAGRGS